MAIKRSELRYKIMTILYQVNLYKKNEILFETDEIINEQLENKNTFVSNIVKGVISHQEQIDEIANSFLDSWTIDRLGLTDQAIIRMAIYELLYTNTPSLVCIDEAIELSKQYSDEKVCKMINGVLDKIYHQKEEYEQ